MKLTRSRFPWDCSIAALATALELPWEEVSAGFPNPWRAINDKEAIGNIFPRDVVQFLTGRGLACALTARPWALIWPPEPFAPVHILWVKLPGNHDIEVNGKAVHPRHCVAWDGKIVLDSLRDEPRRLADYPIIELAIGIQQQNKVTL